MLLSSSAFRPTQTRHQRSIFVAKQQVPTRAETSSLVETELLKLASSALCSTPLELYLEESHVGYET